MTCPICTRGPIWAGNAYVNGSIQDIYHPCACPAPTDEDYLAAHPWHDDRAGYPGETEYPALDVPVVDYDRRAA